MNEHPNDCMQALLLWWNRIPSGCRAVTYATLATYLLWYFPPNFPMLMVAMPYYIFYKWEVYRLLFSTFVNISLIGTLVVLYFFLTRAPFIERRKGSVKFLFEFILCCDL
mmetsp:Transcript_28769/g.51188  ORF Transcript_28769/g.51188 Transcript_28769/m.51188 type:complete len:110 (-) Transcript_28769:702-1031(-)